MKVTCDNGECLIAKGYLKESGNSANRRLSREFKGLQFLFEHGVKQIPQPLYADYENQIGIFEYIDGKRIDNEKLQERDIENAAEFLGDLHTLTKMPGAKKLEKASDACFTLKDYWDSVQNRLARIQEITQSDPTFAGIKIFLETDFVDTYQKVKEDFLTIKDRLSSSTNLDTLFATLNPSDFGFHNALRLETGELRYIDFEYFGWDDAAKLVADFLHHPALRLTQRHKERFIKDYLILTAMEDELIQKIRLIYFLVGLKWCLLMLNVCLPEKIQRKRMAHSDLKESQVLSEQIHKARAKLTRIEEELTHPLVYLR